MGNFVITPAYDHTRVRTNTNQCQSMRLNETFSKKCC